jgi:hypothetical protein
MEIMNTFNWQKKQHMSFTGSFETLYKDDATGAKKWVITRRSEFMSESTAEPREEFYGPKDEGPFKTEQDLIEFLPHQVFNATCEVCTHRMTIVCPTGIKTVNCTNCGKEIQVPKTIKEN